MRDYIYGYLVFISVANVLHLSNLLYRNTDLIGCVGISLWLSVVHWVYLKYMKERL